MGGILVAVRRGLLVPILLALLLVAPLGGRAASGQTQKPRVYVPTTKPFTVRGIRFHPQELVNVVAWVDGRHARRVRATATGVFTVRFRGITVGSCEGYTISARGNQGSRAGTKLIVECPAP
jgi:hypothetical protein